MTEHVRMLLLIAVLAAATLPPGRAADPMVTVSSEDAEMNAAIAHARATVDTFLKVMQSGTADSVSVKVPISDAKQTEHFWLTNVTYANGTFSGTIDNDPELVKTAKLGQKVTVAKTGISDWLYMKDGKMYGNFTVRVLLPKLPKDQADQLRAVLAE